MAVDDWYLNPQLQKARAELLTAHQRLRDALPLGQSHADVQGALERAKRADEAYYALFPGHIRERMTPEEDPAWAATDAAASQIEGFTAGDPSD